MAAQAGDRQVKFTSLNKIPVTFPGFRVSWEFPRAPEALRFTVKHTNHPFNFQSTKTSSKGHSFYSEKSILS